MREADPNFEKDPSIKWNFTKFLADREGTIVARYEPTTFLEEIEGQIKILL
jgi:glutathione peroxidase